MPEVVVSLTAEAAGDYADNDVISASASAGAAIEFANVVQYNDGEGRVVGAAITCSVEAFIAGLRLWLFNANPTASTLNDNAAFSIAVADRSKFIGFIDFAASADFGAVSLTTPTAVPNLPFKAAAGTKSIYGILQATDAFTNEAAGMTITIKLITTERF